MIGIAKKFDQNKYVQAFMKERYIRLQVLLNKEADADIIETLDRQPNKSQFVKDCIRETQKKRQ